MEKTFNAETRVLLKSGDKMQVEVDFTKLSGETIYELAKHGLKQKLADAGADKTVDSQEAAEKTLQKIMDEGFIMGAARGGGARVSPVEAECRAIVARLLIKAKGLKKTEAEKYAKDWRKVVKSQEGQEKVLAQAEKTVKQREVKESIELSIPEEETTE